MVAKMVIDYFSRMKMNGVYVLDWERTTKSKGREELNTVVFDVLCMLFLLTIGGGGDGVPVRLYRLSCGTETG